MSTMDSVAPEFEKRRTHLRAIASRMLGSFAEADDAVQETWVRLARADLDSIRDLDAWLTTVVSRVCLDALRARGTRKEQPLEIVSSGSDPEVEDPRIDPEGEVLLAESIGLALYVVMDELSPAERVSFILHDVFAVPFDTIGTVLGRSADASKMLASRARRRIRLEDPDTAAGTTHRDVIDAFFAAARAGDLTGLLRILAPDIVMTAHSLAGAEQVLGAPSVARRATMFARPDATVYRAVVAGQPGVLVTIAGRPMTVMAFTVRGDVIEAIHTLTDPDRLSRIVPPWLE